METKQADDDLMLDTPYGRKRWGTIRRALDCHNDLLATCKLAADAFANHLDYDCDENSLEREAYRALQAAIAKAEGGA